MGVMKSIAKQDFKKKSKISVVKHCEIVQHGC